MILPIAEAVLTLPPLTLVDLSELTALASVAVGVAGWMLNLALSSKYVKTNQCNAMHLLGDTVMNKALDRISAMERASLIHHTHLERVEEHLRSVDKLAEAQTKLETDMALSAQPVREFKEWMGEIKVLLGRFMEQSEQRGMDHEKRLTQMETRLAVSCKRKGIQGPSMGK